jgi:hypothetical protein
MSSKVKINSVVYNLADGSIYRDYYNETLNNGIAIISQISQLTIEPFDEFEISFDYNEQTQTGTWLKFFVLDIQEEVASFTPALYNYTIVYVSRTIILQKIILPNISVTQRIRIDALKLTIYDKINQYVNMYGPKTKGVSSYENTYPISTRLMNKTDNIDCHEFTLQQPTLFDALNVLLSTLNCIIVINQSGELDYIDLTQTGASLVKSSFNEVVSTQMGMEYVSDLQTEINNALTDINDMVTETAWISPRQLDSAFMTNQEVTFYTQLPIYKIVEVKLNVPYRYANAINTPNAAELILDLTPLTIEYDRYILLYNENISGAFDENYKKFYIYYKLGEKSINGLFANVEWYSVRTFINIYFALTQWLYVGGEWWWNGEDAFDVGVDYRNTTMQIKYIPLTSTKLSSSKLLPSKHKIIMPNNQETSFVDVKRFGVFNEQNANRLGNPELTAIKRYDAFSSIPSLGDKIDDYILAGREVAVYDGFVNFKGSFYKDYVQKTLYTGINARRRMWAIAKSEEAIERSDLYKMYCEFGFTNKLDFGLGDLSTTTPRNTYTSYLMGRFGFSASQIEYTTGSTKSKIIGGTMTFTYADATTSDEIFGETALYQAGRSALITMTLEDNSSAGLQVVRNNVAGEPGALQNTIRYVDNNGEFVFVGVRLLDQISNGLDLVYNGSTFDRTYTNTVLGTTGTHVMPIYSDYQSYETSVANKSWKLPKVFTDMYASTNIMLSIQNWYIYKDSREKTRLTIQNEFCSQNKNVIVTPMMAKYCGLTMPKDKQVNVRLYYSTTEKYSINDTIGKGTKYSASMPVSVTNNVLSLTTAVTTLFASIGLSNIQSWAVTNIFNEIIVAVNKVDNNNINTSVYLNVLKERQ